MKFEKFFLSQLKLKLLELLCRSECKIENVRQQICEWFKVSPEIVENDSVEWKCDQTIENVEPEKRKQTNWVKIIINPETIDVKTVASRQTVSKEKFTFASSFELVGACLVNLSSDIVAFRECNWTNILCCRFSSCRSKTFPCQPRSSLCKGPKSFRS